jgi:MFS family permease
MLIDAVGWRPAFLSLAAVTLVGLALALPRVRRPDGSEVCTDAVPHISVDGPRGAGLRLVTLSAAAFLCCACMGVPLVHLASFVGMICGSPAVGATSLLVAMLFGAAGRICFGLIADRLGYLPSYAWAPTIQTVSVVAYPLFDDSLSLVALSAVFGFGFAGNMTSLVLCIRDAVPTHRFGGALGMVMLVAWAGMGIGGYAGGALFDIYLNYAVSFMFAGVAGLLNLIAVGAMMGMCRRVDREPERGPRTGATCHGTPDKLMHSNACRMLGVTMARNGAVTRGRKSLMSAMWEDEQLSSLIGDVYDAALDASFWPAVLGKVRAFVGGQAAVLCWKDEVSKCGCADHQDGGLDPHYVHE